MAAVGLLPCARTALEVATAVLPPFRSRCSKHPFPQPQLLAVPCRMRYQDWPFRETAVRLREHREGRRVLPRGSVPDYTTRYRFRKRRDNKKIAPALGAAARRRGTVGRRRRARVAVDATGLAPGAVSTFWVRRLYHHTGQPLPWRHGLPWLVAVAGDRQLLLSQTARRGPGNDCANLPAWVETANPVVPSGGVLAEAACDRERNHPSIRRQRGARRIIPAQRGKKTWRLHGVRAARRRNCPRRPYARRAWVETVFSTVQRKLSARAPGRSLFTQLRQALWLGLAYNLYRL